MSRTKKYFELKQYECPITGFVIFPEQEEEKKMEISIYKAPTISQVPRHP